MKLTDLKNLAEHVSPLKAIVDELASQLQHADEGLNSKISVSQHGQAFEILLKDWGDVLDDGSSDYDEHKNHLSAERALNGIVNKFSSANSKCQFTVKYFDEGNYFFVEVKQKVMESVDKSPVESATEIVLAELKKSSHSKGRQFSVKSLPQQKGNKISSFDWGFWRENERGSGMSVSGKTESDLAEIVKDSKTKIDKKFPGNIINVQAYLDEQELTVLITQERPVSEFM